MSRGWLALWIFVIVIVGDQIAAVTPMPVCGAALSRSLSRLRRSSAE
jgi:hypothetical protein